MDVCLRWFYRYSAIWQWSDNSTALYYNISHYNKDLSRYCAAYHKSTDYLSVIECNILREADLLCEIPIKSRQPSELRPYIIIAVPAKPAFTIPGMIGCQDRSDTRHFLGCDVSSGGRDSPDTPPCPHDRRDLDSLWFQCRDNSCCVPYTLVCDHRQDCADGSDENFCVFQPCDASESLCDDEKQVGALFTCQNSQLYLAN